MTGTFFSSDFVIDNNGNNRLIEINTDTTVMPYVIESGIIDYTEFFEYLETTNITEIVVVYKPDIHINVINHLSQSMMELTPFITTFTKVEIEGDSIFPISTDDSDNKFILRMAYDESAILDSEYAKGTLNLLTLFVDNDDSNSIVNFYHSSSLYGSYNTLDYTINNNIIPDIATKTIFEEHKPIGFYKLGNSTDTNENRWNSFIENEITPNLILQQYHFNNDSVIDNKLTSIRNFSIVCGPDLNLIPIGEYVIDAILELPNTLDSEIDDSIIANKLSNKHYHEFTTNAPKPFTSGLLGTTDILIPDNSYTKLQNLKKNDIVESYFISGSPQTDSTIELLNWKSDGIPFPYGSFLTSSIVMNIFEEDVEYNTINELVINDTDKIYCGTKKIFLVYDSGSNSTVYKYATNIDPTIDYLYDISASIFPITKNNMFILEDDEFKLIELDIEETDTYLISGSNHYNAVITHNVFCFVAGTKISMANGISKNVEDIKLGDIVVSHDLSIGQDDIATVVNIRTPKHNDIIEFIFSDGVSTKHSSDHPYYVEGKGWSSYKPSLTKNRYEIDTNSIEIGDTLKKITGENVTLIDIKEIESEMVTTYSFGLDKNYTYYADKILVHNKSCFIKGTTVTMKDGELKNIEDVQIGDEIISLNEETKENEIKKVVSLNNPIHNDIVKYTLSNGTTISSTLDHPFYVNLMDLASMKPEWTNERYKIGRDVIQIKEGDILYDCNKKEVEIKSIEVLPLEDTETFIITVEDNHNFYANNILVHNK